ncbi:MotE family protein [Tateyamaria sp. syn59]|uniref:MotE family protein n=1 Tax=Tateyamaria sp. syn59 TaxID=2576942 RepID=UPI00351A6D50
MALLLSSAAVRVGTSATSALADVDLANGFSLPLSAQPAQVQPKRLESGDIQPLLDAIQAREAKVTKRENAIAARSKALDVAQTEVERRLVALEAAERQLRDTLAIAQTAAEDDLARLTTVYENMKPKEASALFEAMEPAFAAGFLGRMDPTVAAKILAGLDPQVAYSISAIVAGRNAQAPKN